MERSIEKTAFPGATNKHDLKFRKNGEVIGKDYIIWRLDKSDGEAKFVDFKPERKNSIASTTTNSERKVEFQKAGQRTKIVSQN
ncbi:hypothetical protein C5688_02530 [Methylocystis sp. MitZ-2018]|nr:hypothetical protein C5688_02530 [Methylocystis sp. MitZ-2018]